MTRSMPNCLRLALLACLAAIALAAVDVTPAAAAPGDIYEFANVPSTAEAGGHPDIVTSLELANRHTAEGEPPFCNCHDPKDIEVHTPAGVIANPHVVSICTPTQLALNECSADSQAGFVILNLESAAIGWIVLPLYRAVPQAGQASLFVFTVLGIPQYLSVTARTGSDYGLDFKFLGLTHNTPPNSTYTVFWGVPGAHKNDLLRFPPKSFGILCGGNPLHEVVAGTLPVDCIFVVDNQLVKKQQLPSSLPISPFTQNPTTCVGPLASTLNVTYYDLTRAHAEAPWPETTGCDKLSFNPSLAAAPTTTETDSASGLAVDLVVPQFQDPSTPSPSEIRGNTVQLPVGFSINPSAADGKSTCSDAEANLGNELAAACPEFSKIGTTELVSSALPGPIFGYIYLGTPLPGDRWRVIVTASGFATNVKLVGSTRLDPNTGQVVTTFPNLPQTPFQEFNLHFFGSERGLFATPTQCGTFPVSTEFQPWSAQLANQSSIQYFTLGSGPGGTPCPNGARPFSPGFEAGVEDNTAGVHSPLSMQFSRKDGEQNLATVNVTTPPGFLASLKGIPYCPQSAISTLESPGYSGLAEQASPACPAASQVGTAVAGAGAGTHPVYTAGRVYLAGPYRGAPLSLVVSIPALSGPYDLGVVTNRVALDVDPETAQITAISDPLPEIQEGVPLRARFVRLNLDRGGFALNPTNCSQFSVRARIGGSEGASYSPSEHFQAANCTDLAFDPKMSLRVSGSAKRRGHPALHTTIDAKPGEANIARTVVTLPRSMILDNAHVREPCTRVQFAQEACPDSTLIGEARATTPLLGEPLEGPVYLRSNPHTTLPNVVIALKGVVDIDLVGTIDSKAGGLRTTFAAVPDAPIASFRLDLLGGKKGLLQNTESLCRSPQRAAVGMVGQNGVANKGKLAISSPCRSGRRVKRHHRRHRRDAGHERRAGR